MVLGLSDNPKMSRKVLGPSQLVLAVEAIIGNTTTTSDRKKYVITDIKSLEMVENWHCILNFSIRTINCLSPLLLRGDPKISFSRENLECLKKIGWRVNFVKGSGLSVARTKT